MNSDICFLVCKHIAKKTGNRLIDTAFDSVEVNKEKKILTTEILNKKLSFRPSQDDLVAKNIIRINAVDFDYIHSVLENLNFRENSSTISPRIAAIVKRLDFVFKKKMIISKLKLTEEDKKK